MKETDNNQYVASSKIRKINKTILRRVGALFAITAIIIGINVVNIAPFKLGNGIAWFNGGYHYIGSDEINSRIEKINQPQETKIEELIKANTKSCSEVDQGFCQTDGQFYNKYLVSPAIPYKPAIPDKKVVTGTCTLCNDGKFSPSCAVGRGACSWHGGVAAYGVSQYYIVKGTPAVDAVPAQFSYTPVSYKNSPNYIRPASPNLIQITSN